MVLKAAKQNSHKNITKASDYLLAVKNRISCGPSHQWFKIHRHPDWFFTTTRIKCYGLKYVICVCVKKPLKPSFKVAHLKYHPNHNVHFNTTVIVLQKCDN